MYKFKEGDYVLTDCGRPAKILNPLWIDEEDNNEAWYEIEYAKLNHLTDFFSTTDYPESQMTLSDKDTFDAERVKEIEQRIQKRLEQIEKLKKLL